MSIILKLSNCILAFRPNKKKHNSGFKCFDIAYYDTETKKFYKISNYRTDCIDLSSHFCNFQNDFHFDTLDGWIRLWSRNLVTGKHGIKWSDPLSTAIIANLEDPEETIEIF